MPLIYADRVKETTSTTGTGTLTLAGAAAGHQSFAAVGDGNTCVYALEDANGAWEVGVGTYTAAGTTLARTTIVASSNAGSAINLSAGTHSVYVTADASSASGWENAASSLIPGGRLTLQSGVPVSDADQVAATTLYYTPFLNNNISLWDGLQWRAKTFSEVSHSLGTVISGRPYDIFAYLNAGTLAIEKLAWTSGTARATAVTLQDGRYCKSGDKTRLLLGTIYTTSTTTTEDSVANRYVDNLYNKKTKAFSYDTADDGHTYASTTVRAYNNSTAHRVNAVFCLSGEVSIFSGAYLSLGLSSVSVSAELGCGIDSTSASSVFFVNCNNGSDAKVRAAGGGVALVSAGHHFFQLVQRISGGAVTGNYSYAVIRGGKPC